MEEADLLKERLQAITDKRRVQEGISNKRTEIDEEKLKLQYIKKKALREQWLMDGLSLSQQTEEEQEALRLQVQDEREQSVQLQNNIDRIDKEIVALEMQELDISDNEKDILRRLKEVERTPEDIIKELIAKLQAETPLQVSQTPLTFQPAPAKKSASPKLQTNEEEPKKAMFAMEISVERDMRTGESQVIATATVTPEAASERGVKVYEDGRKSVYALRRDDGGSGSPRACEGGALAEMTPVEVEELLRQATETKVPSEVQYHHPVYSSPYTGNSSSRPSTPRTPGAKSPQQTSAPDQTSSLMGHGAQSSDDQTGLRPDASSALPKEYKTPNPESSPQASTSTDKTQARGDESKQILSHIPSHAHSDSSNVKHHLLSQPQSPRPCAETPPILTTSPWPCAETPPILTTSPWPCAETPPILTNGHSGYTTSAAPVALVSITARCEGMPAPMHPIYTVQGSRTSEGRTTPGADAHSPAPLIETVDFDRRSPLYPESEASFNLVNSLPDDLGSGPITMIFMGYQTAEDDEEDQDIVAELVVIGEVEDQVLPPRGGHLRGDESLSFHPEGYTSKVFRPAMGMAKVGGCRDAVGQTTTYPHHCEDLLLLPVKPTFTHKPGQRSPLPPCPGGRVPDEPPSTGSNSLDEMTARRATARTN